LEWLLCALAAAWVLRAYLKDTQVNLWLLNLS
jgi:hypothetical protein